MKVAIVGAGITGCLLANFIESKSVNVSIFEKSRGCGGRASTKQTDWGQCDLGATTVLAQKVGFKDFMGSLCDHDIVSQWPRKIFVSQQNTDIKQSLENVVSDNEYYVFNSKMNAACRHWIKNANLHTNNLISQIRFILGKGWQLKSNGLWQAELFDKVVITAPWPQSKVLIEQSELSLKLPDFSQSWTSCWSIAFKLNQLVVSDADLVYFEDQSIRTLVRDSGKPLRPQVFDADTGGESEIWVAQLTNNLSDELGKEGKDKAISIATKELCKLFDLPDKSILNTYAHYWRYARPRDGQKPLGIFNQHEFGLYAGGDWSFGSSIESAYEAALAFSQSIIMGK
jgi:renalase